jgi:hypothetical protein
MQQYFNYIVMVSFSGGETRISGENHRPPSTFMNVILSCPSSEWGLSAILLPKLIGYAGNEELWAMTFDLENQ